MAGGLLGDHRNGNRSLGLGNRNDCGLRDVDGDIGHDGKADEQGTDGKDGKDHRTHGEVLSGEGEVRGGAAKGWYQAAEAEY